MTVYKGSKLAAARGAYAQAFGNAWAADDTTTVSAALTTSDRLDVLRVARGVRLTELFSTNGDLDTGTPALAYKVGYRKVNTDGALADNDSYFGSALTALQAPVTGAAPTRYAFAPITFEEDVFITVTPTTGAAALAAAADVVFYARGEMIGGK